MKKQGFTIVELLIVIVVIAILAAITIVAYNGIQQRARNAQRIAAAQQWQKLVKLYTVQNATYPVGAGGHYCLGSGYVTNWDANPDEDCLYQTSIKHTNTAINTAFATIGSLPNYPVDPVDSKGANGLVSGISIRRSDTLDPTGANIPNYPTLWYFLEGANQDCVLRPVMTVVSGGITINTSATYSSVDNSVTVCRIGLPDPTTL